MPLIKKSSVAVVEMPKQDAPTPAQTAQVAVAKAAIKKVAQKAATSKEEYWTNKEANDAAKDKRISRSGLYQACLQSVGLLQLNTGNTLEDYLKLVEQAAERGLAFVNKQ
jgi:hypothetical protein